VKAVIRDTEVELTPSQVKMRALEKLENLLCTMQEQRQLPSIDFLTKDIHVMPHFHGNRSPLADPEMRGMISGISTVPLNTRKLIEELIYKSDQTVCEEEDQSFESLALLYLSTVQSLAYGTKHIIEEMNKEGHKIDRIFMCGGLSKNTLFVNQHANATQLPIFRMNDCEDAMLLGCAVLSSVTAGIYKDTLNAMKHMCHLDRTRDVHPSQVSLTYHAKKYHVYREMIRDYTKYRSIMNE